MSAFLGASLLTVTLLSAAFLASSAAAQAPEALRTLIAARFPDVRWVDTETLADWMADGHPLTILDARSPEEVDVSQLRGARRIDPDRPDLASLGIPHDARVVVYCSVGWRSGAVAERMREAGFTNVSNLVGGIFAWANESRPVFRGGHEVHRVHPYDATWGRMLRPELRAYHP